MVHDQYDYFKNIMEDNKHVIYLFSYYYNLYDLNIKTHLIMILKNKILNLGYINPLFKQIFPVKLKTGSTGLYTCPTRISERKLSMDIVRP